MNGHEAGPGPRFALDSSDRTFLEEVRRKGREALAEVAVRGEEGRVHRPLVEALAREGLLQRLFPEDPSVETPALDLCLMREGLARECAEAELALALQALGAWPIRQSAGAEVRERWIPEVAAGKAVAAFALSEPGAGSDPAGLTLRAERAEGGWRLHGEKTWISNAPEADVYTVFARTSEGRGARGISAFCVPGDSEGLSGEPLSMVAPHPIGRLRFDGVFAPDEALLGEVDEGFKVAMRTLDLLRPSVGAMAVGMASRALDLAVAHAREREAFGRRIREFQAVSHRLAMRWTEIEAARLLVYHAASSYDAGKRPNSRHAAMAKLFATEAAQRAVDDAVQVVGAAALENSHPLSDLYREVRAPRIYEGTSEIQCEILARELFDR